MFHAARVVIMFHGAAAANVVFCEEDTLILEVTFFEDFDGARKWRSNAPTLKALRPQMIFAVYYLPLQVALPHLNSSMLKDVDNVDLFLKAQSDIQIGETELDVIYNFLRRALLFKSEKTVLNVADVTSSLIEV